jgi:hypothetical protein
MRINATAGKQSTGLFSDPPFESLDLNSAKKKAPEMGAFFLRKTGQEIRKGVKKMLRGSIFSPLR